MKAIFVLTAFALFWETSSLFCPDFTECFFLHTCCPAAVGFGCCPLLGANCCDELTCCPSGYICTGTPLCIKEPDIDDVLPVECEDGKYYCPPHSKCCPNESKTDGCCAFSNGVHCEDGMHYCPPGTQCSKTGNTCVGIPSMGNSPEYVLSLSLSASFNESSLRKEMPWFTKAKLFPKPKRLPYKH